MNSRLNIGKILPEAYAALAELDQAVANANLDPWHLEMIRIRSSLINGCAYCVDGHTRDANNRGVAPQKITLLPVWREAGALFTKEEQAILLLTEEMTVIHQKGVSDVVYNKNVALFGEKQTAAMITSIIAINAWNRIGVALRLTPSFTP